MLYVVNEKKSMHANSALMLSNNSGTKSFGYGNRAEKTMKSLPLLVLASQHAVHGGPFIKKKAKKPSRSKSAEGLSAVAEN